MQFLGSSINRYPDPFDMRDEVAIFKLSVLRQIYGIRQQQIVNPIFDLHEFGK